MLGWAGVQLRDGSSSVVIDPLRDPEALWAFAADLARDVALPAVVAAEPAGDAVVALVTHLHRDHADTAALKAALRTDGLVLAPEPFGGDEVEEAALEPAATALRRSGLTVRHVRPWERVEVDGWAVTALPAADGTGDPQVSWLVERDAAVVHCGDTLMHGWWWRIARRASRPIDVAFLPINGARVRFPHRRPPSPLPAVMTGSDAAIATASLGARRVVPMHFGAYDLPPLYVPDAEALASLHRAAATQGVAVEAPDLGAWFAVA